VLFFPLSMGNDRRGGCGTPARRRSLRP